MRVNDEGYVEKVVAGRSGCHHGKNTGRGIKYRDWWLVKYDGAKSNMGALSFKNVYFPEKYVGKKIRIKVEVLNEKKRKDEEKRKDEKKRKD